MLNSFSLSANFLIILVVIYFINCLNSPIGNSSYPTWIVKKSNGNEKMTITIIKSKLAKSLLKSRNFVELFLIDA